MTVWFSFTGSQGVPVVKPAFSPAVHCMGVRALSRPRAQMDCMTFSGESPRSVRSLYMLWISRS